MVNKAERPSARTSGGEISLKKVWEVCPSAPACEDALEEFDIRQFAHYIISLVIDATRTLGDDRPRIGT
jgi:hypothetical protein